MYPPGHLRAQCCDWGGKVASHGFSIKLGGGERNRAVSAGSLAGFQDAKRDFRKARETVSAQRYLLEPRKGLAAEIRPENGERKFFHRLFRTRNDHQFKRRVL